ncbi:MAG: CoA transferase [Chloroflexi bacterium]|nr:CoA transferase [Chloroflexota bacterium]
MTQIGTGASTAVSSAASGPLLGVRVLDLTEIIAGPMCTMLLSDMGADVIKVEPPEGESWRLQAQFMPAESKGFMSLNRGKRGMAVNLKTDEGRAIVHAIARDADVAVVNYRPDVPARLGVDYETLSSINPRIIYASNTAFGRLGPHAHRPGYDIILQAMSGLMAGAGAANDHGVPTTVGGTAVADFTAGLIMAWSICAALYARERTGEGQQIDTSLFGAALTVQTSRFFAVEEREAEVRSRLVEEVHTLRAEGHGYMDIVNAVATARGMAGQAAANVYYRVYQTKDDFLAVGCLSQSLRIKFCQAVGLHDPRLGPGAFQQNTDEARAIGRHLVEVAEARFREHTSSEWLARFDAAAIPAGPVRFAEELFDDPHVLANDLVVDVEHALAGTLKMIGPPVRMSRTPLRAQGASPALGQHTDDVLRSLGYDEQRIASLRERGIVR